MKKIALISVALLFSFVFVSGCIGTAPDADLDVVSDIVSDTAEEQNVAASDKYIYVKDILFDGGGSERYHYLTAVVRFKGISQCSIFFEAYRFDFFTDEYKWNEFSSGSGACSIYAKLAEDGSGEHEISDRGIFLKNVAEDYCDPSNVCRVRVRVLSSDISEDEKTERMVLERVIDFSS